MPKIKMNTTGSGPWGGWKAGETIEVDDDRAAPLLAAGNVLVADEVEARMPASVDPEVDELMELSRENLVNLAVMYNAQGLPSHPNKRQLVAALRAAGLEASEALRALSQSPSTESAATDGGAENAAATTEGPTPRERRPVDGAGDATGPSEPAGSQSNGADGGPAGDEPPE